MKIAFVTGSRADWGLLEKLYDRISQEVDTLLFVTGSHLSPEYGHTVDFIDKPIDERIEIVLSGVTPSAITKSMALAMMGFGESYERRHPECVVVLGDRYESFCAVAAGHVAGIPVAHLHGGEVTLGSLDNAFRHSMSMMATYHFPAAKPYADRLRSWGLTNVHCVGALGCQALFKRLKQPRSNRFVIAYYGSETIPRINQHDICVHGSHDVNQSAKGITLSRNEFIEYLYEADAIIGNSSSGIIEAPAMGVPTINIGDRQEGRLMASSIIPCPDVESLPTALETLYSAEFQEHMKTDYRLYYKGGNVSERIADILLQEMRHAQ